MLEWFLSQGVGLLLGALFKFITDRLDEAQRREDIRRGAAAETAAKVNAETVEKQREVESTPRPSDGDVGDSMRRGDF